MRKLSFLAKPKFILFGVRVFKSGKSRGDIQSVDRIDFETKEEYENWLKHNIYCWYHIMDIKTKKIIRSIEDHPEELEWEQRLQV